MSKHEKIDVPQTALKNILDEMFAVRLEIEQKAQQLQELSVRLARTAKQLVREDASAYTLYANAWLRFVGVVKQSLQRSAAADRMLKRALDVPSKEVPIIKAPTHKPSPTNAIGAPTNDDFAELYGDVRGYEIPK